MIYLNFWNMFFKSIMENIWYGIKYKIFIEDIVLLLFINLVVVLVYLWIIYK